MAVKAIPYWPPGHEDTKKIFNQAISEWCLRGKISFFAHVCQAELWPPFNFEEQNRLSYVFHCPLGHRDRFLH
jgi:hypothetical protein